MPTGIDIFFLHIILFAKHRSIHDPLLQAMREKVEAEYNASQVNAVTQGLDGSPVVLIQVSQLLLCLLNSLC